MNYLCSLFSIVSLVNLLILPPEAKGNSDLGPRPNWTRSKPLEDITYKYYLGISSESSTESQATASARLNAREQAIRENFGGLIKIQTETYQNNSESQSVLQTEEVSPQVILQDFEEVSIYVDSQKNLFNAWVLYRFKKSSIQREKTRISLLSKEDLFHSPIIAGSEESAKTNGSIEIKTSPPGISVRIDGQSLIGEMELRTPLKLLGLFYPGEHVVELDDPRFKLLTKKVRVTAGTTIQINEKMHPATGKFKVVTNVADASIKINHRSIDGIGRNSKIELPAETAILIEITHSEMKPLSKSIVLHRDDDIVESFTLEQKPSYVTILSQPSDARVKLDDIDIDQVTPIREFQISRGAHKLVIEKDLYHSKEVNFEIKGGQKKIINAGTLQKYSDSEIAESVQAQSLTPSSSSSSLLGSFIFDDKIKKTIIPSNTKSTLEDLSSINLPSYSIFFGISRMDSPIEQLQLTPLFLSFGFSCMLGSYFSFDGEYSIGGDVFENKSAMEITDSITRYRFSFPLSFALGSKQIISISPDLISLKHSFTLQNNSEPFATLSQSGTGVSFLIRTKNDNSLFGFRLSVHQFSDAGNLKGQRAIMGGLEWYTGD